MTILLLSGDPGSGKDTVAEFMVAEFGFTRLAFADVLKQQVAELTGIPLDTFNDRTLKDRALGGLYGELTARDLLLEHAKRARARDINVFSRIVWSRVKEMDASTRRVVISDWRYQREFLNMVEILGTSAIDVVAMKITRSSDFTVRIRDVCDLERFPFDHRILNDGTKEQLFERVRECFV